MLKQTLVGDSNWPGLPVRGRRRQWPLDQPPAERPVFAVLTSRSRPIAAGGSTGDRSFLWRRATPTAAASVRPRRMRAGLR